MDTRQLAAFCAVVERRSFSQAAERLGVTQPAVSLQVRSLEKRLGTQLLDRSGRRVEPTEAGLAALPRRPAAARARGAGARRARGGRARASSAARSRSAPRPARAASSLPVLLCEFQREQPGRPRRALGLRHADGRRAGRRARARARRRRRRAAAPRRRLRAVLPRRGRPRLPARPPLRRADGRPRRAARGAADRDAGGRRRPPDDRGRAARGPARGCATSTSALELGLQESARSPSSPATASPSSRARRSRPTSPPGTLADARVEGLEPAREISLVRARRPLADARRAGVRRVRRASGSR